MVTPQVSRRQFVGGASAVLALMGVGGLAGCGGNGGGSGSADSAGAYGIELGDELTIISMITNATFTPVNASAGFDKVVLHTLFDSLFQFDADGNMQPMLAESYEQDGFDVTIKIRDDVAFTDGNPVTADDVVFSFDVYENDPVNGPYIRTYISGIEKVDDTTVLVHSLRDDELWKNVITEYLYIMEAATYDAEDDYSSSAPTGSGAYTLESVDEARTVTLAANEDYWGGAPEFKTVHVQAPVDSSTALVALQNGEANLVTQIALTAVSTAREDPNLEVSTFASWSQQLLGICVGDQPFRQAIFHAIDRQRILDICNEGEGEPAQDMFAKKVMGDLAGCVEFTGYDLDLAKEYIAQTEMDLTQTFTITTPDAADVAQCIQEDLAQIGITTEVAAVDMNTFSQALIDKTAQMFVSAFGTDMLTPDSFEELFLAEGSFYYFPVSDELRQKVADMLAIPSIADRRELVIEIMEDMVEEAPIVPLYDKNNFDVYTKGLGGVLPSSSATYAYYLGDFTNEQK